MEGLGGEERERERDEVPLSQGNIWKHNTMLVNPRGM